MELTVRFSGAKTLECSFGEHVVRTDQPANEGGAGNMPSPSEYFLASLATCGAYYVQGFCEKRDIPLDGVEFRFEGIFDQEKKLYGRMEYRISLPASFPSKYKKALALSVDQCFVKKHFANPPEFEVLVEQRDE